MRRAGRDDGVVVKSVGFETPCTKANTSASPVAKVDHPAFQQTSECTKCDLHRQRRHPKRWRWGSLWSSSQKARTPVNFPKPPWPVLPDFHFQCLPILNGAEESRRGPRGAGGRGGRSLSLAQILCL